jgi:hypothetical protein
MATDTRLNSPHHKYVLNENTEAPNMSIEGIHVSKAPKSFFSKQHLLHKYIRTKENPKGILDYEEYIPATGRIIFSNLKILNQDTVEVPLEELQLMGRDSLIEIAHHYNIDAIGKRDDVLVKKIYEAQKKKFPKKDKTTTEAPVEDVSKED